MRPLHQPDDRYWYQIDPASYDLELDRMRSEYDRQWREHMGRYADEPKPTINELKADITRREKALKRLHEMKVPQGIIDNEQQLLDDLLVRWTTKDYQHTDADRMYRKEHEKLVSSFNFSWTANVPPHVSAEIQVRLREDA